jgi:hypothetical protein
MTTLSDIDDIERISSLLESHEVDGCYGYIDLETGELLFGHEDDPEPLRLEVDEEDDEEFEKRYLSIPHLGSQPAYNDMVDFIETVSDEMLRTQLERAIAYGRPFAHFKDVIKGSDELDRWYEFSGECRYNRTVEWLKRHNINLPNS